MENGWEDASDECFLNAYDAFVCESSNSINNDSFDYGVSDSQIMVGVDGWTHRVLEGPLATSTQTSPGEKSFTSALTLAEEFIREDAVDAQSTSLKDYLKETVANIVLTINNNYSMEQNINIGPFLMAYSHQGQSGLSDFILEKSSELLYNILEAFFIKGVDLCASQEINDLDAKETEEENSATTSTPIVTLDEEEEPSDITAVPVITLEDESKDIFDLSLEDAETKEKRATALSHDMNRIVEEIVKIQKGNKKRGPQITANEPY
ncbi:uncharacterized protein LOC123270193 [Cotesia glomerata]|uniref:uncharacterized protein LOC123270193 n=1 Tax=Cotesia glomerata TaxID=32391 RepID=UPI001D0163A6|nr:uncharacterized protein LOC123270193 [Cotesia glomerata]